MARGSQDVAAGAHLGDVAVDPEPEPARHDERDLRLPLVQVRRHDQARRDDLVEEGVGTARQGGAAENDRFLAEAQRVTRSGFDHDYVPCHSVTSRS